MVRAARIVAALLASSTLACASLSPADFVKTTDETIVGGALEIVRLRDEAMAVLSAYYGDERRLDLHAVQASAVHADRVYRSAEEIRDELGEGVRIVPMLTTLSGLQYYVLDEDARQVVAIRGTEPTEIRNWVASLVISGVLDDVLRIDVHEGFLLATRLLEVGLVVALDRSRPVHLVGHSLGGSLATLLGLRLERRGYAVSVTTFGAPKITTFEAFANEPRLHRLNLTRIVNAGDVVHHYPATMDTSGTRVYAHVGREWTLNADGECMPTDLAVSLSKSAALVTDRNLPEWSLDEHGMATYVTRLEALVRPADEIELSTSRGAGNEMPATCG